MAQGPQTIKNIAEHGALLGNFQHLSNRRREFPPGAFFRLELLPAAPRQLVILGAPVVLRSPPFGLDPTSPLQSMQGGIERTLLDAQNVAGDLLNALRNAPAVLRFEGQGLEDQQVECSLRKVDPFVYHKMFPFWLLQEISYTSSCRSAR